MAQRPRSDSWLGHSLAALLLVLALPSLAFGVERERHNVVVDGHALAVWSKLPEHPHAVMLLVHGRTWSARPDFDLQVPGETLSLMDGLVAMNIATYAVDLRGYGESARDGSGWLTPGRAAADVSAVVRWAGARHAQLGKPYLFGWSYGAMVSQLVAQSWAQTLGGLILFGYPVRPGFDQTPEFSDEPPRVPTTAEAAASDFLIPGTISEVARQSFVSAALAADPVRADWRELEQWRQLDPSAVQTPTLLLQAEHDPLALADVHADLFARLGSADKAWVVIPGGDHAAFLETPRPYFLSVISSFVFRGR